jgi:hypothetical protein
MIACRAEGGEEGKGGGRMSREGVQKPERKWSGWRKLTKLRRQPSRWSRKRRQQRQSLWER